MKAREGGIRLLQGMCQMNDLLLNQAPGIPCWRRGGVG